MSCPGCGAETHSHSLSVWCVHCGWGRNHTQPSPLLQQVYVAATSALLTEFATLLRNARESSHGPGRAQ